MQGADSEKKNTCAPYFSLTRVSSQSELRLNQRRRAFDGVVDKNGRTGRNPFQRSLMSNISGQPCHPLLLDLTFHLIPTASSKFQINVSSFWATLVHVARTQDKLSELLGKQSICVKTSLIFFHRLIWLSFLLPPQPVPVSWMTWAGHGKFQSGGQRGAVFGIEKRINLCRFGNSLVLQWFYRMIY